MFKASTTTIVEVAARGAAPLVESSSLTKSSPLTLWSTSKLSLARRSSRSFWSWSLGLGESIGGEKVFRVHVKNLSFFEIFSIHSFDRFYTKIEGIERS